MEHGLRSLRIAQRGGALPAPGAASCGWCSCVTAAEPSALNWSGSPMRPNARRFAGHLAELTARELGLGEAQIARVRFATLICGVGRDRSRRRCSTSRARSPSRSGSWSVASPSWGRRCSAPRASMTSASGSSAHRERPDGRGYPRGLTAEQIPLEARILAVTEAYVAMTSDRPYRLARDHEGACLELRALRGNPVRRRRRPGFPAGVGAAQSAAGACGGVSRPTAPARQNRRPRIRAAGSALSSALRGAGRPRGASRSVLPSRSGRCAPDQAAEHATRWGSNWAPAHRRSSARASLSDIAGL